MRSSKNCCTAVAAVAVLCTVLSACTPSIAPYSAAAYRYATDLKVESIRLMKRAEEPFMDNQKKVETLEIELEKAFEFSKGRPRNEYSTRQWELLLDPEGRLLGGFLSRWRQKGRQSPPFIRESIGIVAAAFDTIIGLESGKIKAGNQKGDS